MSNNDIRSKMENIDQVVKQYAEDISEFRSSVNRGMQDLDSAMGRLSNAWSGSLHDNFAEKMRERQASIRGCMTRANNLQNNLSVISQKMAEMLKRLNKASEDLT